MGTQVFLIDKSYFPKNRKIRNFHETNKITIDNLLLKKAKSLPLQPSPGTGISNALKSRTEKA